MQYQFGRYVEVEIRNFENSTKTLIGNDFEIEFDYFKTLDQTKEDDSGTIRIYGLTPERVEMLQSEGGEVILRCGYTRTEISVLFIAKIVRLYSNISDNNTVTIIECSANLLNYYYTGGLTSDDLSKNTIADLAVRCGKILGAASVTIHLPKHDGITEKIKKDLEEFLVSYRTKLDLVGTADEILRNFCNTFGFEYMRSNNEDGTFNAAFNLSTLGAIKFLKIIASGYSGVSVRPDQEEIDRLFQDTLVSEDENLEVLVLNYASGLIESKTEYKIATAYRDQALSATDVETIKSQEQRAKESQREEKSRISNENKLKKAEGTGKDVTLTDFRRKDTITVNRKFNRVKALLNPTVKPQSLVAIIEDKKPLNETQDFDDVVGIRDGVNEEAVEVVESYSLLRVRTANFKGNNKRSEWIMELYCEDSDAEPLDEKGISKLLANTSSEDVEVEGIDNLYEEE